MAKINDIRYFYEANTRGENDKSNRIREDCLLILNHEDHPFFKDKTYGPLWNDLKNGFAQHISKILQEKRIQKKLISFALQKRAHLNNHYDFDLTLVFEDEFLCINWEFKFNSMPQFVNLYDHERLFPTLLAEYWYDQNIVDQILSLYSSEVQKPSRDLYLKEVRKAVGKDTTNPFFKQLYEWDHNDRYGESKELYNKKLEIVHAAIKTYLNNHISSFNIQKLKERIHETQEEKIYGIWKPKQKGFNLLEYSKEMLTPVGVDSIKCGNSVLVNTKDENYQLKCLLRWKNYQGIGNPAWQISLERRAIPYGVQTQI